jgi:glyoxylase-like metal-dependent hydrolase (beta-lactamase superfamily II)
VRDLFFLTSGTSVAPRALAEPREGLPRLGSSTFSNTVAVAVRDNGDVVLVDCGWSREACAAPRRVIGPLRSRVLGMRVQARDAIAAQLVALGIDLGRVKTIIATHMHLDHVGGVCDFPNAEVVCSDVELSAYRLGTDLGYRRLDLEHARLRPVYLGEGPSYGFGASHDLFGDGEIVLLDAHGHTPGLVAVALRTRDRCYVDVGDAAYQAWEWGLAPAGPSRGALLTAWRRDLLAKTYASIRDCEADPRRPVVFASHDLEAFMRLPHAPASANRAA